jgi:HEAT repeat protein
MTFYCWRCFSEIMSGFGTCPRCAARQDVDERGYVEKLRAALVHPLAETRRRAIFLLGEKRAAEAIEDLSDIIADEPDPFLAEEATLALGKIGDENALNALTAAARHRSFIVRARAVEALAAAGGNWARLAGELARADPSAMVRGAAAGVGIKGEEIT